MFVEQQLPQGGVQLQYVPTPDGDVTHQRLAAGVYKPTFDSFGTLFFRPTSISTELLVDLDTEPAQLIREEIVEFFNPSITARLQQARVAHRRAILLYGPPGTGKTSLVRAMFPTLLDNDAIVLIEPDISALENRIIPAIRLTDPARPIAIMYDEFTNVARGGTGSYVLRLLDGLSSPQNILFFGTTNHIHLMPPSMRSRPSRFSLMLEIDAMPLQVRMAYAQRKYPMLGESLITELAEFTKEMALDYLEEACKLSLMGKTLDRIQTRFALTDTRAAVQKMKELEEDEDYD